MASSKVKLTSGRVSKKKVLDAASKARLTECFVIGFEKNGDLYIASTTGSQEVNVYMLGKAKHELLSL